MRNVFTENNAIYRKMAIQTSPKSGWIDVANFSLCKWRLNSSWFICVLGNLIRGIRDVVKKFCFIWVSHASKKEEECCCSFIVSFVFVTWGKPRLICKFFKRDYYVRCRCGFTLMKFSFIIKKKEKVIDQCDSYYSCCCDLQHPRPL